MRATGLLAGSGGSDGLDSALEEVAELESLNEVTVVFYVNTTTASNSNKS